MISEEARKLVAFQKALEEYRETCRALEVAYRSGDTSILHDAHWREAAERERLQDIYLKALVRA